MADSMRDAMEVAVKNKTRVTREDVIAQAAAREARINEANNSQKESVMENKYTRMDALKTKINNTVVVGMELAHDPKIIGVKVATMFNNIGDKRRKAQDVVKLSFAMVVEGVREVGRGYKETRNK